MPGDYWLVEERAAAGYKLIRPLRLRISEYNVGDNKNKLIEITEYAQDDNSSKIVKQIYLPIERTYKENAYGKIEIVNEEVSELPDTGGSALSSMLVVVGCVSILLSACYFVRKQQQR